MLSYTQPSINIVLIKALLAGLPVVASNAGGSAEVISSFAAECAVYDVDAYADQIVSTWENIREITLSAQSQVPLVREKFGVNQMRKAYETSSLSL